MGIRSLTERTAALGSALLVPNREILGHLARVAPRSVMTDTEIREYIHQLEGTFGIDLNCRATYIMTHLAASIAPMTAEERVKMSLSVSALSQHAEVKRFQSPYDSKGP